MTAFQDTQFILDIQHSTEYLIPKNWVKARFPSRHSTYNVMPNFRYLGQSHATCGMNVIPKQLLMASVFSEET